MNRSVRIESSLYGTHGGAIGGIALATLGMHLDIIGKAGKSGGMLQAPALEIRNAQLPPETSEVGMHRPRGDLHRLSDLIAGQTLAAEAKGFRLTA